MSFIQLRFGFLALVLFLAGPVAIASESSSRKDSLTELQLSTLGSALEVGAGAAMIATGVGSVPGAVLVTKGVADLLVDVHNIGNLLLKKKEPVARSAIGVATGQIVSLRGGNHSEVLRAYAAGDRADFWVSSGLSLVSVTSVTRFAIKNKHWHPTNEEGIRLVSVPLLGVGATATRESGMAR